MKNYLSFLLVLSFSIAFSQPVKEQKEMPLQSVIGFLQAKFGVVLSYDVELVKDVPVKWDTTQTDLKNILASLNSNTAFNFEKINAHSILVKPKFNGNNFIICGSVLDKKTREPLIGSLVCQSHGKYGVYAEEDASFKKAIKYSGTDSILVNCIGYEKRILPMSFFMNGCVTILLESQRIQMNEVAVTAYLTTGVSYDASDNSLNIRPRNLSLLPGSVNGDVLGSLDALPGISSADGRAGNLNIRGSSPDQTMINVDEIPIYLKGHYFGTISPINPNAVDNINVQRSMMSVNKGGRAGGIIDIRTPSSVTNKFHSTVAASALDANAYVHAPIIKDKLSFAASGRHSYPYSVENPALRPVSDFVFQLSELTPLLDGTGQEKLKDIGFDYADANAKLNYNITEKHKGSTSYLFIQNDMYLERYSPQNNTSQRDDITMHNWGANTSLYSNWAPRFNSFVSLTHSFYTQTFTSRKTNLRMDTVLYNSIYENIASDWRFQAETDWKFAKDFNLKTGYDGRALDVSYLRRTSNNSNTSFSQNFLNYGVIHSGYTTLSGLIGNKFLFNAGLRANYFTVDEKISFEPRVFMSYKFNEVFRLKSSGGYQKQFITQVSGISIESIGGLENQLWLLADNRGIPEINSLQASFGGMFEKNSWLIDIEGYYREISNITSISVTAPLAERPFINGNIYTQGVDLLVRKQWKNFDTWISYSLSDSKMKFDSINSGQKFFSLYDQTHILDIAGSYRIKQWKFSLAWKYRTGLAALPGTRTRMIHGAPSGNQQQTQQPPPPPPPPPGGNPPPPPPQTKNPARGYEDRFPDYHQLDASVYFMFPKEPKKIKGTIGVSVLNCYNQSNIIEQIPQKNEMRDRLMPALSPNIFFSISF